MLHAEDFRGLYAIIPTPARPGSDRWDARSTVDLDETARLVDRLIEDGSHGIIALGTTGECPTLSTREYSDVVRVIAGAANHRVPVFIGATALGLHDVIDRLAVLRDAGVEGTLLGVPMWQPLTEDMAVDYYAAVAQAYPELAVMVYANERAFRFPFRAATGFWARVVERAPTVTSAKSSRPEGLAALQEVTGGQVHFLPSDMVVTDFAALAPERTTACWATAASMGPWPSKALMDAVAAGDAAAAERVAADIRWSNEPIGPLLADQALFASYNIQMEKLRIDAAGYCTAGPPRPPYASMPDDLVAAASECGRRWAQLCDRYRPLVAASSPDIP